MIDLAKGARLALSAGVPYLTVAADLDLAASAPALPLVAIPTTAGSGSEVSGGIVIADEKTHTKTGIAAPFIRAQYALVDPALTYGAPANVTSWGGIDALAQAIAALVTDSRKPIGTGIALEAIHLAARALPTVVADGENRAARQEMACASLMAGLAMNISDCGSEHSLAMTLGGRYGLPHGLTVGLVLAESMDVDRRGAPDLFERIADALGEPADGTHDGSRAVRGVREDPVRDRLPGAVCLRRRRVGRRRAGRRSSQRLLHHARPVGLDGGRCGRRVPTGAEPGRAVDLTSQAGWLIVAPRYKSCFQMFEPGRIDDHEVEAE